MKCRQCGCELAEGLHFCTRCGTKVQPAESSTPSVANEEFRAVFKMQEQWNTKMTTFVIKVNGVEKCRLKNGETKEIMLSRGSHRISVSTMMAKAKKFTLTVNRDRHLTCSYATGKALMWNPLFFSPIVVRGENGIQL